MSDQTPSQAEGERDDDPEATGRQGASRGREDTPRSTPSQAEGEREEEAEQDKT